MLVLHFPVPAHSKSKAGIINPLREQSFWGLGKPFKRFYYSMPNAGTGQSETAFTGRGLGIDFGEDQNGSIMIFVLSFLCPLPFCDLDFLFFFTLSPYHFLFKGINIMHSFPLKS